MPGRACQQNADLAKAEEQKAAARSRYGERREESEGFHRPPAAERRFSIQRARWGRGGREEREVKGDASSERVRGGLVPARSGGAGEGKRGEAAATVALLPRAAGAGGGSAGLRGVRRRSPRGARAEGALLSDRGEPAMSDRAIQRRTELTRSLPALNYCLFHFSACLMNKPAIRLMLQVTLSCTQVQNVCMGLL